MGRDGRTQAAGVKAKPMEASSETAEMLDQAKEGICGEGPTKSRAMKGCVPIGGAKSSGRGGEVKIRDCPKNIGVKESRKASNGSEQMFMVGFDERAEASEVTGGGEEVWSRLNGQSWHTEAERSMVESSDGQRMMLHYGIMVGTLLCMGYSNDALFWWEGRGYRGDSSYWTAFESAANRVGDFCCGGC